MVHSLRSLESMTTCSGVTACLSEGETECKFVSARCPPCLYALTGGDYSCYSRGLSGDCPFLGTYAECDERATSMSPRPNSGSTTSPSTEARATKTPSNGNAPTPASETPATTTENFDNHSPDNPLGPTTTSPSIATANGSDLTHTSATPASDSDPTPSSADVAGENVMVNSLQSSTKTSTTAHLVLVGGAVALVAVVMAFVVRRIVSKKKLAASDGHTALSGHSNGWSDRTLTTDSSGGTGYTTYGYTEDEKRNSISMLSDSQASGTFDSGFHGEPGSGSRTTADFSKYGGNASTQFYADYSVRPPGLEYAASSAAAGGARPYLNHSVPSTTKTGTNFVDVTGSSTLMRGSELESMRSGHQPLTVSQLLPKALKEGQEEGCGTQRPLTQSHYKAAQAPMNHLHTVNPATINPLNTSSQVFGGSTASSMYDIVDPMTMLDVEARSTEMHAEDNQYPKFSFASTASSGIFDGTWSKGEGVDESQVHEHVVEHMI